MTHLFTSRFGRQVSSDEMIDFAELKGSADFDERADPTEFTPSSRIEHGISANIVRDVMANRQKPPI